MTARPHDALFKSAFETPTDAAALLRELLPAALGQLIAWDTLHGEPASFVDPALADHHGDLLFSARLRTDAAELVHVLLEHQSTADPAMPLRTLSYHTRLWNRFRKEPTGEWLPRSSQCSSVMRLAAGRRLARSTSCSIRACGRSRTLRRRSRDPR
jgi:hypothetical protein